MADNSSTHTGPRPTQKRSFFAKPTVSRSEHPAGQEDATDFFRQSSTCFSSILHEQEQRKKEKLTKKLKAKLKVDESDEDIEAPAESRKKRRLSKDEDDLEDENKIVELRDTPPRQTRSQTGTPLRSERPLRHQTKRENSVTLLGKPNSPDIVDLGDSDSHTVEEEDDELYAPPKQRRIPVKPKHQSAEVIELADENEDPEEDEYLHLIAKARERKRQKDFEALKQSLSLRNGADTGAAPSSTYRPPDPPVAVFISSTIAGAKPLIVKIYLSKKIGELFKAWSDFNQLSEHESAKIFLAWRRLKQWPTTTLKRMLEGVVDIEVRDDGTIISKPGGRGDGLSDDYSKIHLVATTDEGLELLRKDQQRIPRALSTEITSEDDAGGVADPDMERALATSKDDDIPIILKEPKDYGELKIKVKPDTTIARVVKAFRSMKKIRDDKSVFLMYDGEKLDPNLKMQDTEIEASDTIEVYVR